ncbi:MarR family winged helix-turn-helix transcriptional regulator [Amycolatopsis solani]|uniref:MarR family winged helix-turn-helix transcriptional regulator n=1 Tax=Amycolatopsis solani TaxID=3028615 RepID=UPI0025B1A717|nr:MarR family transcriptional regulator [Amycolatopsis sp. MEP2-6]
MANGEGVAVAWDQWRTERPDLDLASMALFGGLKHAHAMLELLLEPVFETSSINSAEFDVLFHLRHAPEPVIARRLAQTMGKSAAALSKALTKLERRGLVVRAANPVDKRSFLVTISDAGAAAVDQAMPRRLALESEVVEALTGRQRADIARAFRVIGDVLETTARRRT